MRRYINNDGLRLITQFEGSPRLKARLCEGGRFELSYGVTFYPDGSPVKEGDTCTDTEALDMFRAALDVFEKGVADLVTVDLNDNQFSALVCLAYNVGLENFAKSTVLRELNARRYDDAAEAFGMWVYATKDGYTQAYRGLLRRRYAEACLFLGYDWVAACADEAIALQRVRPASIPGKDKVVYKTALHDVLRIAQEHRLPTIQDTPAAPASPVASAGTQGAEKPPSPTTPASPASQIPAAPVVVPSTVSAGKAVAPKPAPVEAPPPPVKTVEAPKPSQTVDVTKFNINNIKVENGAKPLETSDRAVAVAYKIAGVGLKKAAGWGFVPVGAADAYFEIFGDPFVAAAVVAGTVWLVGEALEWWGNRKRKKHNATATTLLY